MKREHIVPGLFLQWNYPGGAYFAPAFTANVKVLCIDCLNLFEHECFIVYRIEDDAVIPVRYEYSDQFGPVSKELQEELQLAIKQKSSDETLEEMIAQLKTEHAEMRLIASV